MASSLRDAISKALWLERKADLDDPGVRESVADQIMEQVGAFMFGGGFELVEGDPEEDVERHLVEIHEACNEYTSTDAEGNAIETPRCDVEALQLVGPAVELGDAAFVAAVMDEGDDEVERWVLGYNLPEGRRFYFHEMSNEAKVYVLDGALVITHPSATLSEGGLHEPGDEVSEGFEDEDGPECDLCGQPHPVDTECLAEDLAAHQDALEAAGDVLEAPDATVAAVYEAAAEAYSDEAAWLTEPDEDTGGQMLKEGEDGDLWVVYEVWAESSDPMGLLSRRLGGPENIVTELPWTPTTQHARVWVRVPEPVHRHHDAEGIVGLRYDAVLVEPDWYLANKEKRPSEHYKWDYADTLPDGTMAMYFFATP